MSSTTLSRRDFLKLSSLLLAGYGYARLTRHTRRQPALRLVRSERDPGLPNILIVVFDTFSAPHASFFGYNRQTTPNLNRFASRATVFHRHYAGGNFTVPGTASLLTGSLPWSHRGMHLFGTVKRAYDDRNLFAAFSQQFYTSAYTHNALVMDLFNQFQGHIDQLTPMRALAVREEALADRLFPNDYATSFWGERVVRGSGLELPSSFLLSLTDIAPDFQAKTPDDLMKVYGARFPKGLPTHTVGLFFLLEDAIDWIKQQAASLPQPFLGYYHLLPPHEPYRPRKEFINLFDDGWHPRPKPVLRFSQNYSQADLDRLRQQYDEYMAYMDAEFGRLYDDLDRSGILENTYLIITSDHGQLFERGVHGHVTSTLYDPVIHIPLLIRKPGQRERQDVFALTSCVDVLPTLMHLIGQPIPDWCEGQPLPSVSQTSLDPERSVYVVEAKQNPKTGPLKTCTLAMFKGRYKLIAYYGYGNLQEAYELYDLQNDPEERENLYASLKQIAGDMREELTARLATQNAAS